MVMTEPQRAALPSCRASSTRPCRRRPRPTTKDLDKYADSGDFKGMTSRINGGLNGLADRERCRAAAKKALGI